MQDVVCVHCEACAVDEGADEVAWFVGGAGGWGLCVFLGCVVFEGRGG